MATPPDSSKYSAKLPRRQQLLSPLWLDHRLCPLNDTNSACPNYDKITGGWRNDPYTVVTPWGQHPVTHTGAWYGVSVVSKCGDLNTNRNTASKLSHLAITGFSCFTRMVSLLSSSPCNVQSSHWQTHVNLLHASLAWAKGSCHECFQKNALIP